MVDTMTVEACIQCRLHWRTGERALCSDSEHHQAKFEVHRHRTAVALPDGTRITGVSFDPRDPFHREQLPDFGLYLDEAWRPPWAHGHLSWPDFGVPDERSAVAAMQEVLARARAGQHVEVGCLGGHGRTGTALACLAVLAGFPRGEAVGWVRSNYCELAVETPEQEAYVQQLDAR